jgi:hypothetical protein
MDRLDGAVAYPRSPGTALKMDRLAGPRPSWLDMHQWTATERVRATGVSRLAWPTAPLEYCPGC